MMTALLGSVLLLAGLAPARAAVVEDFTGFANGTVDTNKNGVLDIEDDGGKTNGWSSRQFAAYVLLKVPGMDKPVLSAPKASGPRSWHAMGKAHGQDVAKATKVELSYRLAMRNQYSTANVWLSDGNQNGYGVSVSRHNYNQASIIKLRDCAIPWPSQMTGVSEWSNPAGEHSELLKDTISVGLQDDDFITFHLCLEQAAPGKPVKLTLWYTGSTKEFPDTSYEKPAQQLMDDGSGKVFNADGKFGPVFDLAALTFVALTAETPDMADAEIRFGTLEVTASK
jgi:hypothetical protein